MHVRMLYNEASDQENPADPMTSRPVPPDVSGRAWLLVCVLGTGFVTGLVPAGLLPANLLSMQRDYGLSHEQAGRMVGLCMLQGGGVGGLLGGWVCGRVGAMRNLLASLAMAAAALAVIGLMPSLAAAAAGLAGYFFALGFMGASNALAVHMLPDGQRGITLLHAANAAGKVAGPVLASFFVYGLWRNSFVAAAFLPVALVVPGILARRTADVSVGRTRRGNSGGIAFWILIGGFGLIAGSEIAAALWIPAFGRHSLGFSAARANLLLTFFLLALVAGRLAASAASGYVAPRTAIVACGAFSVFAMPAISASGFGWAVLWFSLFGLAFSATWPSYFAYLSRAYPHRIGVMSGAAVFSTQAGFAACSWVSGWLAEAELRLPILFGAAVMGAFTTAFLVLSARWASKGESA